MRWVLGALAVFSAAMANAEPADESLNLNEVELRVRIEMNDPREGHVTIQNPNNPNNVCGWYTEKIKDSKSIEWRLFFYDKNIKEDNGKIVSILSWRYAKPWETIWLLGATTLELCYKNGYIPSPQPVGPYAKKSLDNLSR